MDCSNSRVVQIFGSAVIACAVLISATLSAQDKPPTVTDYVVGPQDVLTITSYDQADLSGKFAVEADGTRTSSA